EEYIASAAARTLEADPPLNIFSESQIADVIHRFYRVKADVAPTVSGEADADEFIAGTARFIDDMLAQTRPVYDAAITADPDQTQRVANMTNALATMAKKGKVTLHVTPRFFNHG